jgi:uncharacterized protein YcfL
MNRVSRAILALMVLAGFLGVTSLALAQTAATGQAAGQAAQTEDSGQIKWVNPVRGTVQIQYTNPVTKRAKDSVVTTITVKNVSNGPIARLKVEEYWYDKKGDVVMSNQDFSRKPVMPGEIITFTLTTPYRSGMNANTYKFTHAYGNVDPKKVPKF